MLLYNSSYLPHMIKLAEFDKDFFETIQNYKKIHLNPKEGLFFTIIKGRQKVGVIGFKLKENDNFFLKIGVHQDFRGQDIFRDALYALAKKYKIKKIFSTIAKTNVASIKAHQKAGFARISEEEEEELKKRKLLLKRNIRMVKTFQ